ncbi:unnamed protein product [Psylliodes chrysocephalus]|uniref:CCHC-type domain-containing protein n=1 Tax=Psylliodes chrysocephalus TaxID=3402493 RepID=A0A9P0CVR9_9CUCU|nr:unnamed protein product [Psylliodes chrysocephala]
MIRDETELDKKIAIHHITGMATEKLRKMSEVVFQKTNTKIDIYTTVRNQGKDRERTTYGMIISEGGKTYKEVLSKVKAIVKTNSSVDAVRSIKSTKDGKLLLTIEKNQDALTNIHKALKDDKSGLKTKRLGIDRYETLHIRGLEADSTAEDIIQSIRETVGNWEEDNKLSELRPLNNDTLAATITLKSDYAETLTEQGFLRVGLVKCRLEKRLNIKRCIKCWSYEHTAEKCEGTDRSKHCFKCGGSDHSSKECTNDESCPICKEQGHKAGTMKCPEFKAALKHLNKPDWRKG